MIETTGGRVSFIGDVISNEQLADWYDATADYIEVHGWTRKQLCDRKTGAVCASGALCAIVAPEMFGLVKAHVPVVITGSYTFWMEAARRTMTGPRTGKPLSYWNDHMAKDRFEVIDLFRNRAKELRA